MNYLAKRARFVYQTTVTFRLKHWMETLFGGE